MKRYLVPLALLVLLSATPALSGDTPDVWGAYDTDWGYAWVAAARALTADGLVKPVGVHDRLRQGLEWQIQKSAADHGLRDGEIASGVLRQQYLRVHTFGQNRMGASSPHCCWRKWR